MKRKVFICLCFFVILVLFAACSTQNEGNQQGANPPAPEQPVPEPKPIEKDPIAEQLKGMTLEEKIGQILIVGIEGFELSENEINLIQERHIGGFILFGKNIESPDQLMRLTNAMKQANAANQVPLILSVDEEGGRITRIPKVVANLPTNRALGKLNNKEVSYEVGQRLAEKVEAFGFNMDYAPVLDINSNPKNPVIGDRSFGSDADLVSELGVETMKGIKAGGVIPVVKHFPGHGDTSVDSHISLPTVNHDLSRLESFEFIPFQNAIQQGTDCIMVAHILLPKIDAAYPASLSKTIITDILRGKLKYEGVVMTDDMNMGAMEKNYSLSVSVMKAIEAGNDIVLVAHKYENALFAFETIHKAVLDGILTEERIDESVYRILRLKKKYNLQDKQIEAIDIDRLNEEIKKTLTNVK